MDIGTGILGGSIVLGAVATAFKLFGSNGNGKSKVCLEHSGVCQSIEDIKDNVSEIKKDVKTLLERRQQQRV